jgi:hypothetical protein
MRGRNNPIKAATELWSGRAHNRVLLMSIEGTYKVNIEQSIRRLGESENETIERMLSWIGLRLSDIPPDPQREEKIQKLVAAQEEDEAVTTMRMEITADLVSIRSTDGDGDYPIKSRKETGDGKINMVVEFSDEDDEESEDIEWDITTVGDRFLVFSGDDEMSGFVWERVD